MKPLLHALSQADHRRVGWWLAWLLAGLLVIAGGALIAQNRSNIHLSQSDCGSCHLGGSGVLTANAGKLLADQESLCTKCHTGALAVSHPSGFVPKRRLPAEYPLDWKGEMTCSTCHDVHGGKVGLMRGQRSGREFCLACHDAAFFSRMRDGGASLMISGHSDARTQQAAVSALDKVSQQCMECHDRQGDTYTALRPGVLLDHGRGRLNHPVGTPYDRAYRYGGYRKTSDLNKKVHLPQGMVSCVSCHESYTAQHGQLVAPMAGSSLCFQCHDL